MNDTMSNRDITKKLLREKGCDEELIDDKNV